MHVIYVHLIHLTFIHVFRVLFMNFGSSDYLNYPFSVIFELD